jgi:hypothetical protein
MCLSVVNYLMNFEHEGVYFWLVSPAVAINWMLSFCTYVTRIHGASFGCWPQQVMRIYWNKLHRPPLYYVRESPYRSSDWEGFKLNFVDLSIFIFPRRTYFILHCYYGLVAHKADLAIVVIMILLRMLAVAKLFENDIVFWGNQTVFIRTGHYNLS